MPKFSGLVSISSSMEMHYTGNESSNESSNVTNKMPNIMKTHTFDCSRSANVFSTNSDK